MNERLMHIPLEDMAGFCRMHFRSRPCESCPQREACETIGVPLSVLYDDLENADRHLVTGPVSWDVLKNKGLAFLHETAKDQRVRFDGLAPLSCWFICPIGVSPACDLCRGDWDRCTWEMSLEELAGWCDRISNCGNCELQRLCNAIGYGLGTFRDALKSHGLWEEWKGDSLYHLHQIAGKARFNACEGCPMKDEECVLDPDWHAVCPGKGYDRDPYWDVTEKELEVCAHVVP